MKNIIDQVPEVEREAFTRITYTIGGMMVFPGNQIERKPTINGARGFDGRIADRFDLTVECIRRHYLDEPVLCLLGDTLARYADFFGLFGDFAGYVDFFHLQDLVDEVTSTVTFFSVAAAENPRRVPRVSPTRDRVPSNRATGASPLTSPQAADLGSGR
jgi:hypothetical protein